MMRALRPGAATAALAGACLTLGLAAAPAYAAVGGHWKPQVTNMPNTAKVAAHRGPQVTNDPNS